MRNPESKFDVIIAGGGMVGATTAIALAKLPISIALVESVDPGDATSLASSTSFDQRSIALSASSEAIYKSLNLWSKIEPIALAIDNIHVSNKGHFGFTRLSAKESGVKALGQVVPLDEMGPILWDEIKNHRNITLYCPDKIEAISSAEEQVENQSISVKLNNKSRSISAKLLLATDGTFSGIAEMAGISMLRDFYHQHALISNIKTEKPHDGRAFERFTNQGPLALLPLTKDRMSLVWCQDETNIERMMDLDDREFINQLQNEFGYRLGRITKIGERNEYPLALHLPEKFVSSRTLLLGNSAHTLHPIAGQGFNLGLRDIAALVDHFEALYCEKEVADVDIGEQDFLQNFCSQREPDWLKTINTTDSLVRIFSNDHIPLSQIRGMGLAIVDKIPFLKKKIADGAMGFSGHSATLTRQHGSKGA
jgi:2-octaprenyl-6-methoxyphenol hydroxylase